MCNKRQNVPAASIISDKTLTKIHVLFSSLFLSPPSVTCLKPQVETTKVFLNYLLTYDVCCVFLGGIGFEKQLLKDESASYSL